MTTTTTTADPTDPTDSVAHLNAGTWHHVNRLLVRKALAEFCHERLLTPTRTATGDYSLHSDDGTVEYRFAARLLALEHWLIEQSSISREGPEGGRPLDALEFVVEFRNSLGLGDPGDPEAVLPVYLEEITSTLASAAFKFESGGRGADDLAGSGFQEIESGMSEGHPCFVANNGRLGFSADEYLRYAPEAGEPVRLLWIALAADHARFTATEDIDYERLIAAELDEETLSGFAATLRGAGLGLEDVRLVPTHPWQWFNRIAVTFAADIARGHIICLGYGPQLYQPQQSIRTFFNRSAPQQHYVKTALSVLNMGFLRGLSADYMAATPAINDWVAGLVASDDTLSKARFGILRERAAVGYLDGQYDAAAASGSPYRKMLAALWRESPVPTLERGERLMTMAALLHVDEDSHSVTGALIGRSGLGASEWLRRYLDAYLTPLLHCFYAHDLVFMPHGENVILVLDGDSPARVIVKDIAEEIAVMGTDTPLPAAAERIRADVPDELRALSLFTDVFDCFFRFLAAIVDHENLLSEEEFWEAVARCVSRYQRSTPWLSEKHARYDLFVDRFSLSCLNRLQLRNNRQMVDLADPAGSLRLAGTLRNPIARFAHRG